MTNEVAMATVCGIAFMVSAPLCGADAARDETGPVARWDFDGATSDSCGATADNLAPRGAAAARYVTGAELPGTSGKAVALGVKRGDAEYLAAPVSKDVKLASAYTIEAWIYPTRVGGWGRLVLRWGQAGKYAYHFALHDGKVSLFHGQAGGKYVSAEGGRVEPGRWHHVAGIARRDASDASKSRLEVYLNGKLAGTARYDGTICDVPREGLGVGDSVSISGGESRYRGYIDELAIWNRALSGDEIRAHADARANLLAKLDGAERKRRLAARAETFADIEKLGVEEIVFAERHPGRDPQGHYYANFGYSCIDPDYWIHGRDGGRLCKLNLRTGELTALVDDPAGAVRDPQVHYDAKKILFSYRKGGTHNYALYEIGVDGQRLRQITTGPWDDVEPTYLPDGGIIFCSTRCKRYIGCWLAQSAILYRCDANGQDMRMLSSGAFTENTPAVLPDGRVLYTRWEYVNRDPVVFHHLWTMNPDGTASMAYFGNMHPGGVFIDARSVPGTDRAVLINSPGHGRNEHEGYVALVTDRHGPDAKSAMRNISKGGRFRDPYPLSANAFLVAQGKAILLMGATGETKVLHTADAMVHEPRPLASRPREKVVPPRVDLTKTTGTLVLSDVYVGRNMKGIKRGAIKKLLVLEDLPKPANFHGGGSQPIGHGVTSTLKRILGTVPVEADGSAHFEVPAMRSVYLAILDEDDRSVKQMRSFMTLQPGEQASCLGCHEDRTMTSVGAGGSKLQALGRPASRITPVAGVPAIPDFPRDVQPILDKHCIKCHNHKDRKNNVVLEGDRGPVFSHSYYTLLLHWQVKDTSGNPTDRSGRQKGNDAPYTTYSSASPLMKKIDGSHNKVKLTPLEVATVRLWIDVSAQYPGTYAAYGTGQIGGMWGSNRAVRVMANAWPDTAPAADAVTRRCSKCHGRALPKHVTDQVPLSYGDMLSWERPMSRFSRHRVFNLTRPDKSLVLLAPLSRRAGGYAEGGAKVAKIKENRNQPPKPVIHPVIFADTTDPDYRKILAHVQAAKAKLDEIKRFDMPGFRPRDEYIREMQRYGVLPQDLTPDAPVDAYKTDEAYWQSMWHRPMRIK